ncbi:ABC transporter permease, partial [bacterium]
MKRLIASKETGLTIILIVLSIIVWQKNPQFMSATNLGNLAQLVGLYGIFSIGLGLIIITGGIDLSVGSVFALLGVLLSLALVKWKWPPVLAVAAALAFSSFLGYLHGALITRVKLQPFIVTLCGLLIYRGLARFIANDNSMGFGTGEGFEWLKSFATGRLFGIPTSFVVMLVIAVLAAILLHRSVYG